VTPEDSARAATRLVVIKTLHTLIWVFFAGCIIAIPVAAWNSRYIYAVTLIAIVLVEVLVILLNNGHCPLTPAAARYTLDRRDNFDIYLPAWLARHNKLIFGVIFICGVLMTVSLWTLRRH
jgi:hypothetical protein